MELEAYVYKLFFFLIMKHTLEFLCDLEQVVQLSDNVSILHFKFLQKFLKFLFLFLFSGRRLIYLGIFVIAQTKLTSTLLLKYIFGDTQNACCVSVRTGVSMTSIHTKGQVQIPPIITAGSWQKGVPVILTDI